MCQNTLVLSDNLKLLISQYQQTLRSKGLIAGVTQIVQDKLADAFCDYQDKLNINLADGVWLDRIGVIFGYPRPSLPVNILLYFGFDNNGTGFDQSCFYPGAGPTEPLIPIDDALYRKLLLAWIQTLFTDASLESVNATLMSIFGEGKGYILDRMDMSADVIIDSSNPAFIEAIIYENVIPRPAGVEYNYLYFDTAYFGFDDNGTGFDQSPFITPL